MTWNELIFRLQDIPEERREEQAVFASESDGDNWIIDEIQEFTDSASEEDGLPGPWPCNVGNEDMTSTYALIP